MAGQKAVNTVAKKAASDGKISSSEAKSIQSAAAKSGGSAALAIANQASRGTTVGKGAQANTGLEIKGNGQITYNPAAVTSQLSMVDRMRVNYGVIANPAPVPSSPKFTQNTAGTYTYLAPPRAQAASGTVYGNGLMDSASNDGGPKPLGQGQDVNGAAAGDGTAAPAGTQGWNNSVDANVQALLDALAKQTEANAKNQELYIGMMTGLADQMSAANQRVAQAGPYAVTTSAATPAAGAQTTSAIAARRKPLGNTSLAIGPLTAAGLGTGLNIAV